MTTGARLLLALGIVTALVAGAAAPASAYVAPSTVPSAWPWPAAANGAKQGAYCMLRPQHAGGAGFVWNETTDGIIAYSCEYVGLANQTLATAASTYQRFSLDVTHFVSGYGSGGADENTLFPLGNAGGFTGPLTPSSYGLQEIGAPSIQLVDDTIGGTTSPWYRITGAVRLLHTCEPGGTGTGYPSGACGTTPDTHASANLSGATIPEDDVCGGAPLADSSTLGSDYGTWDSWLTINAASGGIGMKCHIEGGDGGASFAPSRPDGSTVPPSGGDCHVDSLGLEVDGSAGVTTPVTTDGYFQIENADHEIDIITEITWHGGPVTANAYFQGINDGDPGQANNFFNDVIALPLQSSGDPVTLAYVLPTGAFDNYRYWRVYVRCGIQGDELDQYNYASSGDTGGQFHGPPEDDPVDNDLCQTAPGLCDEGTGTGGNASALACFAGLFYEIDFGFASFPWVHITEIPGDLLCFLKKITIGDGAMWSDELGQIQTMYNASPMKALGDVITLPFNAWSSFSGAYAGGDCHGPVVHMPMIDTSSYHTHDVAIEPFNACSEPLSTAATIVRVGITASLWLGVFWLVARLWSMAFGFTPGEAISADGPVGVGHSFPEASGNKPEQGGSFL